MSRHECNPLSHQVTDGNKCEEGALFPELDQETKDSFKGKTRQQNGKETQQHWML